MRDLGTAGFHGFDFNDERTLEVFYYDGGHSKALAESNIGNLIDFLVADQIDRTQRPELRKYRPHWVFEYLSRIAPLLCAILVSVVAVGAWLALPAVQWSSPTTWIAALVGVVTIRLIRAI